LRCEGTKRGQILVERFSNINAGSYIRTAGRKNKEHWQNVGLYMIKYNEKWERVVIKKESGAEINPDDK
jgi:hypothetical protein